MPSCVLRKCKNYGSKKNKSVGVSYYTFPSDDFIKHKWVSIVQAERSEYNWMPTKSSTICSEHFKNEDKCTTSKGYMRLKKTAVPVIAPNEDSLPGDADDGNEVKVFCPKCNTEISHTAEGIQQDQAKIIIAKVYHYFEQEYEELKKSFDGLELTPLSKFRQRTALATGVSESMVLEILQEEARRNAEAREGPSQSEGLARKRPRQADTDSSSDEDSDNNEDGDDEQSSAVHEEETLVVKEEPDEEPVESYNEEPEIYVALPEVKDEPGVSGTNDALADPISTDVKIEPQNEEATSSTDTVVVQRATKSYKGRKAKRKTEASPAASAPPTPNAPPTASAPPTPNAPPTASAAPPPNAPPATPKRQLLLLDDGDIKMEQIESEDAFS